MSYEYKVVPAPVRGLKAKGVKTAEDRFANALQTMMNDQAKGGWEYLRTDTLPSKQREGLMSKTTVYQNMLVFRRAKRAAEQVIAPSPTPPITAARPKTGEEQVTKKQTLLAPQPSRTPAPTAPEKTEEGKSDPSSDVAAE